MNVIIDLIMVGIIFWGVTGSGLTLLGLIDKDGFIPSQERWPIGFGIGAVILYILVAAVGAYSYNFLSMSLVLGVIILLATLSYKQWQEFDLFTVRNLSELYSDKLLAFLWIVLVLCLVSLLFQGFAPPNDYDSIYYHIALPKRDLEQGFLGPNLEVASASFFPALMEHMFRLGLALRGESLAQALSLLFGLVAAQSIINISQIVGLKRSVAIIAALMFINIKAVVWELATCEVEVGLGMYIALAMSAYLRWRDTKSNNILLVLSLLLAGSFLTKYHGIVVMAGFAIIVVNNIIRNKIQIRWLLMAIGVGIIAILPHLLRNTIHTGNPLFPLFHSFFFPESIEFYKDFSKEFGRGRSVLDFLRMYWDIFIFPTYYFDGGMIGAPYMLAFTPFAFLRKEWRISLWPIVTIITTYSAAWFWEMSQQVRFLIPVMVLLVIFTAQGLDEIYQRTTRKYLVIIPVAILFANQMLFTATYAYIRLPVVFGFKSYADYLTSTPTFHGGYYNECKFISDNLQPGEKYLSLTGIHSYFCPQTAAVRLKPLPGEESKVILNHELGNLSKEETISLFEKYDFKYVHIQTKEKFRVGIAGAEVVREQNVTDIRIWSVIKPILPRLKPLIDTSSTVYDGKEILKELQKP